jgi:hypothetical protein
MDPDIVEDPGLNPEKSGTSTPGRPLVTGGVEGELEPISSTLAGGFVATIGAASAPPADEAPCPSRPLAAPTVISGSPEPDSLLALQLERATATAAMMPPELAFLLLPISQ